MIITAWQNKIFVQFIHINGGCMKLKDFLGLLEHQEPDLDILFDVKDIPEFLDFAHLTDCYSDGEALILEFK